MVAGVMQGLSQLPPADAAVALAWLVMAGVDTAVDDCLLYTSDAADDM
jgi:hypothetical protein